MNILLISIQIYLQTNTLENLNFTHFLFLAFFLNLAFFPNGFLTYRQLIFKIKNQLSVNHENQLSSDLRLLLQ